MSQSIASQFYDAFSRRDGEAMAALYTPETVFSDPVFPHLHGEQSKNMWRMLCSTSKDLRISYEVVSENDLKAVVKWDAFYTFSKTGRSVHNRVIANLTLRNGRIVAHRDDFSFWRWSRQALGPAGLFLGWSPTVKSKVQAIAAQSLKDFHHK